MRIAVSGPPGSGKTTVSALVAKALGYELVLVGQVFRRLAEERGVGLEMFGALAEEDETIDKELDRRTLEIAESKADIVLEGRLTAALIRMRGIPALTVYVNAPEEVRAARIAQREGKDPALAQQVRLPHKLLERPGPHAIGEGRPILVLSTLGLLEQLHRVTRR